MKLHVDTIKSVEPVHHRGYVQLLLDTKMEQYQAEELFHAFWGEYGQEWLEHMLYCEGYKLVKHNDFKNHTA